jgi:hypothetical protein
VRVERAARAVGVVVAEARGDGLEHLVLLGAARDREGAGGVPRASRRLTEREIAPHLHERSLARRRARAKRNLGAPRAVHRVFSARADRRQLLRSVVETMRRRGGRPSGSRRMAAIALICSLAACGGKPLEDAPTLATATAVPVGAPGATGVSIPASPVGSAHEVAAPDGDAELPKHLPPTPFAPEQPTPPPQPSSGPHSGAPKKPPAPKGIPL